MRAGSYRNTDGRGGCDGARIRFAPEFLWEDNTNLDKALRLLEPSYAKFSDIISWCAALAVALAPACGCPGASKYSESIPYCVDSVLLCSL